jgi:hypothetical protein
MVSLSILFCNKFCLYEASLLEYETASKRLGTVPDEDPDVLYSRRNSPIFNIISKLLGELPLVCTLPPFLQLSKSNFENSFFKVFCAFSALAYPTKLSLASIAIIQHLSGTLRSSLNFIRCKSEDFRRNVSTVRNMYNAFLVVNSMSDGTLSYPPVSEKRDSNLNGMSFEVRYIYSLHHHVRYFLFIVYIYNLLGMSHSLIQEAKQQRLLLTTFR